MGTTHSKFQNRNLTKISEFNDRTVAARFVTTARFVTKEVVTNRAGIVPFFLTWISVHVILCVSLVSVRACVCGGGGCKRERREERKSERK